ncbi:MAG: cysteine desulfurase [Candidatus Sungbacteria bacterium]|nr:cysteine desulfurase [Candidatus Sungbacteria bacterium]
MKEIYLDHAATTPLDARVQKAMEPYWSKEFGNPSSLHRKGVAAKKALEESRKNIAGILHCKASEIIFTGGGTEAVNLGIIGFARANAHHGRHIVTMRIEHHAVLHSVDVLRAEGFDVTTVGVSEDGLIDPKEIERVIRPDTILVSVMYANNEIGTIQPIAEIGKVLRRYREKQKQSPHYSLSTIRYPLLFTDACQAAGALELNVEKLGVDMLAVNGSKIYGPKGIGCLYAKSEIKLEPVIVGGGQEKGMRSGTENIPAIVGFAEALEIAADMRVKESERLTKLRDWFIGELLKKIPDVVLNGHPKLRLPNNINISIPGIEGEAAVIYLDAKGIYCSTGSACSSVSLEPSHVILELGRSPDLAQGSLRFTLGRSTTKKDLEYVLKALAEVVKKTRFSKSR